MRLAASGAACMFLCVAPAAAQPVQQVPESGSQDPPITLGGTPVTLTALLAHAERRAPAVAVAEAEVNLSDADLGLAEPVLPSNPTLQAGVGPRIQGNSNAAADLNVHAQLFQGVEIGGQRPRRFDVARAARTTRERAADRTRWQVRQQIQSGYRAALATRRGAELTRRIAAAAAHFVEVAQRRVEAGEAGLLMQRLAEADATQTQQRAVAAFQAYRDACLSLAEIAGWPAASPPEPMGELPAPRGAPTLAVLTELARGHNPELLMRRAELAEAGTRVDLAHREAWPGLQLGVRYGYEGAPGGGIPEHVLMGMLRLEIPSFDLNQGAAAQRSAERGVAEARRDALSSVIEVRLERLRTGLNAAAAQVSSYGTHILPRFEENLTMLQRAFELGEIDILRVSVALERFLSAQQQALTAQVAYSAALAALEAQVGESLWQDEGDEGGDG